MSVKLCIYIQKVTDLQPSKKDSVYFCQFNCSDYHYISKESETAQWNWTVEIDNEDWTDQSVELKVSTDIKFEKNIGSVMIPLLGHSSTDYNKAKLYPYTLTLQKKKVGTIFVRIGIQKQAVLFNVKVPTIEEARTMDLDTIKIECLETIASSHASTQRSTRLLDECIQMGNQTMSTLQKNTTQLNNVQGNLDKIHEDLSEGKRELRSIHSLRGQIANSFTKSSYDPIRPDKMKPVESTSLSATVESSHKDVSCAVNPDLSIFRLTNDEQYQVNEIKENIDQIGQQVKCLKQMGNAMSDMLDDQIQKIDVATESTMNETQQMKKVRSKVRREF